MLKENKPKKEDILEIDIEDLPEDMIPWYEYWMGFYDIDFFTDLCLSHYKRDKKTKKDIDDAVIHMDLRSELLSNKNLLVTFPRNHAKSTNSFFVLVYQIAYGLEESIGLICSEGLGIETIGKIRDEFETNEKLQQLFGRLVPNRTKQEANKKRTKKSLDFLNGCSIESLTLKGTIRGKRFTRIVIDDPQEDKDVRSMLITEQFNNWFFATVFPILDPSGNCIIIGTNVGELSFVNMIIKEGRGFLPLEYQAVYNPVYKVLADGKKHLVGGQPLRVEKRTIESLNKVLQVIGRKIFQQEYMNIPFSLNGEPIFDQEIVNRFCQFPLPYDKDERYRGLHIFQEPGACAWGIDLSMGGNHGDFSTIVARDQDLNLVFVYQGRILWYELIDVIDHLDDLGYYGTKVFERNLGTAQAIFDMVQDKVWYNDIYQGKTMGQINEKQTLNLGRHTNRQNKEKMIADLQYLVNSEHIDQVDERQATEMKFYIFDDKGGMNAMPGHHDDTIIADALSIQGLSDMFGIDVKNDFLKRVVKEDN